ncbi:YddF family protein [Anaerovirgula multivorans]
MFNGTVVTTNGLYKITDITIEEATKLIKEYGFVSADHQKELY